MTAIYRVKEAYMGILRLLFVFCLASAAVGCASLQVRYDYDRKADFSKLKKYDWFQDEKPEAKVQELMVKRIENEVNTQLKAKGIQPAPEHPDFLIRLGIFGRPVYGGSTGVGFSVGVPVGGSGAMSVGSGTSRAKEKLEWTMILDFLDPDEMSVIWNASATDRVSPRMSPEQQERLIHEAVTEMLLHFPPKKK
jgi:hypothetical protein